jgi:hypothetical protein
MQTALSERFVSDRRDADSREHLLRRVRSEFEEMPCLRLTAPQAGRLFGLRYDICDRLLRRLVCEGTLMVGRDERYKLRDDAQKDAWPLDREAAARGFCHDAT